MLGFTCVQPNLLDCNIYIACLCRIAIGIRTGKDNLFYRNPFLKFFCIFQDYSSNFIFFVNQVITASYLLIRLLRFVPQPDLPDCLCL